MKSSILKILPYIVGIGLGLLLFNPPAFLHDLGTLAYLVMAALVALLFLVFVGFSLTTVERQLTELVSSSDDGRPPGGVGV